MLRKTKTLNNITSTPRAIAIQYRTYCRPLEGNILEIWEQATDRVIGHQRWLWERALGRKLNEKEEAELAELRDLYLTHRIAPAGRTNWLGGTEISMTRESSMFNCAHSEAATLYDVVDMFWLLLNGCGVGFTPVVGGMHGFRYPLESIDVIRSTRTIEQWEKGDRGQENNTETYDPATGTWTLKVGDSATSWAKTAGKLLVGKYPAKKLIIDLSEIRSAGIRLKGYGWISSGDNQISKAFPAIAKILSERADQLLTKMDILDIMNHLGSVLSSRRSAEIALVPYGDPEWREFSIAKKDYWLRGNDHRRQSNNSLVFYQKPARKELEEIFGIMQEGGGDEPGFLNGVEARKRAPWFSGMNPCVEIILANKGFCNLSEVNLLAFKGDTNGLRRAIYLAGRANYRQTCVDLRDGVLQEAWHTNNDFLRLCGVGLTAIVARPDLTGYDLKMLKNIAVSAAHEMARELGTPMPKNVTCVKPSGTRSKVMGTTEWGEVPEGAHMPEGKYIFNEVLFSKHDELVKLFQSANYTITVHPNDPDSVLIRFPVAYENVPFTKKKVTHKDGTTEIIEINGESAIQQLDRYKLLMDNWCEQNVSFTVKYDPAEVPAIITWILKNWDSYVGVSWQHRNDPTKTAADLGHPYLPQTVVSEKTYRAYVETLKPVKFGKIHFADLPEESQVECAGGACPIK